MPNSRPVYLIHPIPIDALRYRMDLARRELEEMDYMPSALALEQSLILGMYSATLFPSFFGIAYIAGNEKPPYGG